MSISKSIWRDFPTIGLLRLGGSIGLGPEVGRGRTALEEAAEGRLNEGVEDKLGSAVDVR